VERLNGDVMKLSRWIEGEVGKKLGDVVETLEGIIKEGGSGGYVNGGGRHKQQQQPVQSLQ
jgi:hypothetical protein